MENKKAWLRIVEAFTTILLIAIVLLLILNRSSLSEEEKTEQITDLQYAILREIQLNSSLREDVLGASLSDQILWGDFDTNDLNEVKIKIEDRTPGQLNCSAKLCSLDSDCSFDEDLEKSIYSRSALISANLTDYNPRKLKLFCWEI